MCNKEPLTSKTNDDGELWSFLRSVLSQGGDIWLDHAARSHEQYSARLDAAARERVGALKALISPSDETPVHLTQSTLDSLIAEADKYMLPVDVKMGAATFRKGVKVGTMLRGLKTHAERQTAEAWNPQPNCRFDEHAETCDWIGCPNNSPGSPTHCPLPWPRAELKAECAHEWRDAPCPENLNRMRCCLCGVTS